MPLQNRYAGTAGLAIIKSLFLAMNGLTNISKTEILIEFRVASDTQMNAISTGRAKGDSINVALAISIKEIIRVFGSSPQHC